MALNLGPNRQTVNNGALNLSRTGAPTAGSYPMGAGPAPNAIMDELYAGAGVDPRYFQQPVAPPSEIEIQMALLRSLAPIDRFVKSDEMGILIELLSNVVSFSVMEILRGATFKLDDEGNMQMDVASLPAHLQTISSENVAADFTTLQSHAQQAVAEAEAAARIAEAEAAVKAAEEAAQAAEQASQDRIEAAAVNEKIEITMDFTNDSNVQQSFALIVQIKDSNNTTISLSHVTGMLGAGQTLDQILSYTPTDPGTYTVEKFLWDNFADPTALTDSKETFSLTVS